MGIQANLSALLLTAALGTQAVAQEAPQSIQPWAVPVPSIPINPNIIPIESCRSSSIGLIQKCMGAREAYNGAANTNSRMVNMQDDLMRANSAMSLGVSTLFGGINLKPEAALTQNPNTILVQVDPNTRRTVSGERITFEKLDDSTCVMMRILDKLYISKNCIEMKREP